MKVKTIISALFAFILLASSCGVVPITGRRQLSLIPDQEVLTLSAQQYNSFIRSAPLANNTAQGARVARVSKNIAAATQAYLKSNGYESMINQLAWEFNLVNSPQVNAFCMPGGKIVVYTGILSVCSSDDQLAAVIAHEVSHAIAKHSSERLSNEMVRQLGGNLLTQTVGGNSTVMKQVIGQVYGIGSQVLVSLPYNRKQEYEADKMGMVFMAMAGYNPEAAIQLWQRMAQQGQNKLEFLSTHPSDANRVKALQEYLPEALKYYKNNGNTKRSNQNSKTTGNNKGGFRLKSTR